MKKRVIVLLILSFLLTGCSITYNLEIDGDDYIESTSALGDYAVDNYRAFEIYSTKPIPLSKLDPVQSESDEKIKSINYYDIEDISKDDYFGLKYSGKFGKNKVSFENSSILSFGVGNFNFKTEDNISTIEVPVGIKLFEQYDSLDEIVVNIKSKYEVLENNADEINNNTYTWYITRSNYKNKSINIKYKTSIVNVKVDNPMIRFAIALLVLCIIGLFIYLFVRIKYDRKNSI